MLIFFFFFASALSALYLYNEPKFIVIGNPVILEQSHAYNALGDGTEEVNYLNIVRTSVAIPSGLHLLAPWRAFPPPRLTYGNRRVV